MAAAHHHDGGDIFVFAPSENLVAAHLPSLRDVVPEHTVLHGGQERFKSNTRNPPQDGVRCPGCLHHYTIWKGFLKHVRAKKDVRRLPITNDEERDDVFYCKAAEMKKASKDDRLECTRCPVCMSSAELQAALRHDCPISNATTFIPPMGRCKGCDLIVKVKCSCPVCNVAPHSVEFRIQPDPWSDCPYPKYPQHAEVISEYDKKRRQIYMNALAEQTRMNSTRASFEVNNFALIHLNKLLQEPDGYIVLSELERQAPGFLERCGASDTVMSRVREEHQKDQTDQRSFLLHPHATYRLVETMKNLEAAIDMDVPIKSLIATISRHNAVRLLTEEQRKALDDASVRAVASAPPEYVEGVTDIPNADDGLAAKRRRMEENGCAPTSAPELSAVELQAREETVTFLTFFRQQLYAHFVALNIGREAQVLYEDCKETIARLLTISVSENKRLADRIFSLLHPVSAPLSPNNAYSHDTEMDLKGCVAAVNAVVVVLRPDLVHDLNELKLEPTSDGTFPE